MSQTAHRQEKYWMSFTKSAWNYNARSNRGRIFGGHTQQQWKKYQKHKKQNFQGPRYYKSNIQHA